MTPSTNRPFRRAPRAATILTTAAGLLIVGCMGEAGLPPDAAPVVKPDSEAARKAIDERDRMLRERQAQEAKARTKRPSLPTED